LIGCWSCSDSVVCYGLSLFLWFLIGCWNNRNRDKQ
jgi:hypothetical protein